MKASLYIEGGGDSKDLHTRCREGFRKLLENCGFAGRLPRLIVCGSRSAAFDDFKTALALSGSGDYVALLIDSEEPVDDIEATWGHLNSRDHWKRPKRAKDDQVLLMTTCMETWIVADHNALAQLYGGALQISALPPLTSLEKRSRASIQHSLAQASRRCQNAYAKGKRSFVILAELNPNTLGKHLPSFARMCRILDGKLVPAAKNTH